MWRYRDRDANCFALCNLRAGEKESHLRRVWIYEWGGVVLVALGCFILGWSSSPTDGRIWPP